MVICGIKLTHDGGIAVIDNGVLVFACETEKLANRPRHSPFHGGTTALKDCLRLGGISFEAVDRFVIDGWHEGRATLPDEGSPGQEISIDVAGYGNYPDDCDLFRATHVSASGLPEGCLSYPHVAGHIASAYLTSPFAREGRSSYVLMWDGATFPQLYYFDARTLAAESLGCLFPLYGNIYTLLAIRFEPFNVCNVWDLSVAGTIMAFIALGRCDNRLLESLHQLIETIQVESTADVEATSLAVADMMLMRISSFSGLSPADILNTVHVFLEQLLVRRLAARLAGSERERNLCFVGGTALNIKWNTALRESGVVGGVWVPPFPNDSGSAIGAACCELVAAGYHHLEWSVFAGPSVQPSDPSLAWSDYPCSIQMLAAILHHEQQPVMVLDGPTELGPRALGNRSIVAPAVDGSMKTLLNTVKGRQWYRPVAPICLEKDAPAIFDPGSADPYMLFEHRIREDWSDRIPAVAHLDNTARLQTVGEHSNPTAFALLTAYKCLAGIPVLCNTSANLRGRGFFPDVRSAMDWGEVDFIWSSGVLYVKNAYPEFPRVRRLVVGR